MKKILGLCVLLFGCQTPQEYAQEFRYAKDERTGICFAMWGMGGNGSTMTYVPCSIEVLREIESEKARHQK